MYLSDVQHEKVNANVWIHAMNSNQGLTQSATT